MPKIQLKIKRCQPPGPGNKTAKHLRLPEKPVAIDVTPPHRVGLRMTVADSPESPGREKSG